MYINWLFLTFSRIPFIFILFISVHAKSLQSCPTLWDPMYCQPLSVGFSRQEYGSELPCPSPEDLPNPGIEPTSLKSPVLLGRFFTTSTTWEAPSNLSHWYTHLPHNHRKFLCNFIWNYVVGFEEIIFFKILNLQLNIHIFRTSLINSDNFLQFLKVFVQFYYILMDLLGFDVILINGIHLNWFSSCSFVQLWLILITDIVSSDLTKLTLLSFIFHWGIVD